MGDFLTLDTNTKEPMKILFLVAVRLMVVFIFISCLLMLIMINLVRILVVWIAIVLGPILIALWATGNSDQGQDILNKINLGGKLDLHNLIKAIFSPVVAVALMSISLIIIIVMQGFIQDQNIIR